MAEKVKLTRRQIKEDKFTAFMLQSRDRVIDHWQYVAIGVVGILLIIAVIVYLVNQNQTVATEAQDAYSQAYQEFQIGNNQMAVLALNQVVEEYGDQPVAGKAAFLLGRLNLQQRNFPESERFFEMYIDRYGDEPLNVAAAHAGIAAVLESRAEFIPSGNKYEQAARVYADGPLAATYLGNAVRVYLAADDTTAARIALVQLVEAHEGSPPLVDARRRAAEYGVIVAP